MMATVSKSNHKVSEQITRKVYLPRSTTKNTLQDIGENNNVKMVDASIQRSKDEELTSLSWLQNTNLLQSINLSSPSQQQQQATVKTESVEVEAVSENESSSWDGLSDLSSSETTQQPSLELSGDPDRPPLTKPPHSFSSLIFLAIESSPSKALPVREIYSFITKHFPYYRQAPVGWKNSVRHNLSLNKCFYKVEGGLNMTKGSLWMVEPIHRPQLVQSLCKVSYIKTELIEQLMSEKKPTAKARVVILDNPLNLVKQKNLPDPELFPFLTRRLAVSGKTVEGPDVDAATAMLALGHCPGLQDRHSSEEEAPSSDHTYSSIQRPAAAVKRPLPDDQVPDASRELEVPYTTTTERQPATKLSRCGQSALRDDDTIVSTKHTPYDSSNKMCRNCVKKEFPNRDRMCTDSGAYMANLKSCSKCQSNKLEVTNKSVAENGDEELVTFEHICASCRHIIGLHTYKFSIDRDYQEYEMECLLCGTGEDSISILPEDPRKMSGLLM